MNSPVSFLKYEGNRISFWLRIAVAISDSFSKVRFLISWSKILRLLSAAPIPACPKSLHKYPLATSPQTTISPDSSTLPLPFLLPGMPSPSFFFVSAFWGELFLCYSIYHHVVLWLAVCLSPPLDWEHFVGPCPTHLCIPSIWHNAWHIIDDH